MAPLVLTPPDPQIIHRLADLPEDTRRDLVTKMALGRGLDVMLKSTVVWTSAMALAAYSGRFRALRLDWSSKAATWIIPISTLTFFEMHRVSGRLATPEAFAVALAQNDPRMLAPHKRLANFVYDNPLTSLVGGSLVAAVAIFAGTGLTESREISASQRLMHARVGTQAFVVVGLTTLFGFSAYMSRFGRFLTPTEEADLLLRHADETGTEISAKKLIQRRSSMQPTPVGPEAVRDLGATARARALRAAKEVERSGYYSTPSSSSSAAAAATGGGASSSTPNTSARVGGGGNGASTLTNARRTVESAAQDVESAVVTAENKAKSAVATVEDKARSAVVALEQNARAATNQVEEAAKSVWGTAEKQAQATADSVADTTKRVQAKAAETVADAAESTRRATNAAADKAKHGADVVADATRSTAESVAAKTKRGADTVADATRSTAESVAAKTKRSADAVADATRSTAESVAAKAKRGADASAEAVRSSADAVAAKAGTVEDESTGGPTLAEQVQQQARRVAETLGVDAHHPVPVTSSSSSDGAPQLPSIGGGHGSSGGTGATSPHASTPHTSASVSPSGVVSSSSGGSGSSASSA